MEILMGGFFLSLITYFFTYVSGFPEFTNTSLTFSPVERCEEVEMRIEFMLNNMTLAEGETILVKIPGFTTGDCDNEEGGDVGDLDLYYSSNMEDGTLSGSFTEGTVENEYNTSYLQFAVQSDYELVPNVTYVIYVDRLNKLKVNCYLPVAPEISAEMDDYELDYTVFEDYTTFYGGICYITDTELDFTPSLPGWNTEINITFISAFALQYDDTVTVRLGGFTSGNASGIEGDDISMGGITFIQGTDLLFNGGWTEGEYVRDKMGYLNSTLTVTLNRTYAAGQVVSIIVDKTSGIKAQCGIDGDTTFWRIMVVGLNGNTSWTSFDTTEAMGPGCRDMDYCNDRGSCDYCLQKCDCLPGFGHDDDIHDGDIAPDCSEFVCRSSVAWSTLATSTTGGAHEYLECSGVGVCNRMTGECACATGYEGLACERRTCPTFDTASDYPSACSGHGRCLPMRELARTMDALPLSSYEEMYWGIDADGTWDAMKIWGCVCDSSWPVGLGSNQTQEAEWFGAACEFRHCPTGDDPLTPRDETNCTGVTAPGGRGVGELGNKCHHDCSGRGKCNYQIGLCECYTGFYGANCGNQIEYYD